MVEVICLCLSQYANCDVLRLVDAAVYSTNITPFDVTSSTSPPRAGIRGLGEIFPGECNLTNLETQRVREKYLGTVFLKGKLAFETATTLTNQKLIGIT